MNQTLAGVPLQRCDLESWRSIMAAPGMQKLHDKAQLMALSKGLLCQVFQVNLIVTSAVLIDLSSTSAAACYVPLSKGVPFLWLELCSATF